MIFPACYFTLLEHSPMSQNDKKFPKAQDSFEFWIIDGKDHLKGKKKMYEFGINVKGYNLTRAELLFPTCHDIPCTLRLTNCQMTSATQLPKDCMINASQLSIRQIANDCLMSA